ncbi:MAG: hypothetical protein GY830_10395 [Bacteroidetes bacterium]|nr:hypothetical protein [Bacteroidota bacterium]
MLKYRNLGVFYLTLFINNSFCSSIVSIFVSFFLFSGSEEQFIKNRKTIEIKLFLGFILINICIILIQHMLKYKINNKK